MSFLWPTTRTSSNALKARLTIQSAPKANRRLLSSTRPLAVRNRVYQTIRAPADLDNLLLLSASSRIPLVTLWSAGWCPSCKAILPIVKQLIEEERVGEIQGSVGLAEVEYDAPDNGELGARYMITSVPTLLAFSRQEAQLQTKVTNVRDMKNRDFLKNWIECEAARGGQGGAGGGNIFSSLFGRSS